MDISDESSPLEGETTEIFVSRLNMYEDGMDELLGGRNYDYDLDVTFSGELVQDMGGPRKEFLSAMMRDVKRRLFEQVEGEDAFILTNNEATERKSHYLGAGLIFGKNNVHKGTMHQFTNYQFSSNKQLQYIDMT